MHTSSRWRHGLDSPYREGCPLATQGEARSRGGRGKKGTTNRKVVKNLPLHSQNASRNYLCHGRTDVVKCHNLCQLIKIRLCPESLILPLEITMMRWIEDFTRVSVFPLLHYFYFFIININIIIFFQFKERISTCNYFPYFLIVSPYLLLERNEI